MGFMQHLRNHKRKIINKQGNIQRQHIMDQYEVWMDLLKCRIVRN